jgi:hypothetical protein
VAANQLDIVVFEVGGQVYALPALDVHELIRAVAIVPLPRAPAIVEGIINLRGKIVPVLDIRSRFRFTPMTISSSPPPGHTWWPSGPIERSTSSASITKTSRKPKDSCRVSIT